MKHSPLLRYSIAVLAVALALLFKLLLDPLITDQSPFLLLSGAVMVSAWFGGLGPGVLATVLSAIAADYYFLPPVGSFTGPSLESLPVVLFVLQGVLISSLAEALRSARERALASAREARVYQENLRHSEKRYRAVIEQAAEGICLIDADTKRVLEANPEFQRMFGYTSEEIAGLSIYDFIAHDREDVDRNFQLTLEKGSHTAGERRYRRKDGTLVDVMASGSAISYGGRKVTSLVIRDITERKRYEEALRASNERFRLLVEGVKDYGIFMLDPEGYVVSWNAGAERIKGYKAEEIVGEHSSRFYSQEDIRRGVPERDLKVAAAEGRVDDEGWRVRKDGSRFWADAVTTALRDEAGNLRGFSKVTRDITERRQVEERLRRSLDSLLALYEAGQILSSTLNRKEIGARLLEIVQRVSNLSAAVISLRDDQERLHVWHTIGPEDLWCSAHGEHEAEATRHAAMETGEHQLFELQRSGPDAMRLVALCLPLRVHDRIIGVLEAYGSEALKEGETVETLTSLASQAASALENSRLYEELADRERQLHDLVGRMLVAQEEERRRVAYDVHDGLTQTAVAAYQHLQAFADDHPPSSTREQEDLDETVDLIQRTVREARLIIADLRPTVLDDLGLAVAIGLEAKKLRNEDYEVSYEETLGDERLPVTVETSLFRFAQEALTNVRKHAQATLVRVSLQRLERRIRLEVRDWGCGFLPSEVANGGGPGERVGLSSMRERVTLLGGRFEVNSKPGLGTSVVAEVPLTSTEESTNHGE